MEHEQMFVKRIVATLSLPAFNSSTILAAWKGTRFKRIFRFIWNPGKVNQFIPYSVLLLWEGQLSFTHEMTFYFQLRVYSKQKGNALLRFRITRTMGLTNKQKVSPFLYLCYSATVFLFHWVRIQVEAVKLTYPCYLSLKTYGILYQL